MNEPLFDSAPIGIFDSGIGGMSIAKALMDSLPYENLLYFGDTRHLPYGKHPSGEIKKFSRAIIEFLATHHCKAVIIACNTATAAIYDIIPELNIPIFNVIDPAVQYVVSQYSNCKIGLLCTDLTHKLALFEKKIEDYNKNIRLVSFKASQLANLIELEFHNKAKIKQLIKEYFCHHHFFDVEAVILGCTHYLWLRQEFNELNPLVKWIEPSILIADAIKLHLVETASFNTDKTRAKAVFCQTANNPSFFVMAEEITQERYSTAFMRCEWTQDASAIKYMYPAEIARV